MKNILSVVFILFITFSLKSQSVDTQTSKLIGDFVKSNIETQITPVEQTNLSKVFSGTFYKINVGFVETGVGASSCADDNHVNINGTTVKMTEGIHMDLECPVLMSLVRKDFRLKDENAAKLFEESLNVIYPVDEKEKVNIKHLKKGTQWVFIRGKFFDDFTAFLVTVSPDGTISKIEVKLAYAVN